LYLKLRRLASRSLPLDNVVIHLNHEATRESDDVRTIMEPINNGGRGGRRHAYDWHYCYNSKHQCKFPPNTISTNIFCRPRLWLNAITIFSFICACHFADCQIFMFCRMSYLAEEISSTATRAINNTGPWSMHLQSDMPMHHLKRRNEPSRCKGSEYDGYCCRGGGCCTPT